MGKTFKESPRDVIERIYKRGIDRRIASGHENQDFRKVNKRKKKDLYNDYEYEQERD